MAARKSKAKQQKVVLTVPDMGLTTAQTSSLKRKFQKHVVESLGGRETLAARGWVVVIIIVFI